MFLPWLVVGAVALALATRKSSTPSPAGTTAAPPPPPPPSCEGVRKLPPPLPGMGTGFDALPDTPLADLGGKSYKALVLYFMALKPTSADLGAPGDVMRSALIEASAIGAEEWAKMLRCSGYTQAADMLYQQAAEIRQWK